MLAVAALMPVKTEEAAEDHADETTEQAKAETEEETKDEVEEESKDEVKDEEEGEWWEDDADDVEEIQVEEENQWWDPQDWDVKTEQRDPDAPNYDAASHQDLPASTSDQRVVNEQDAQSWNHAQHHQIQSSAQSFTTSEATIPWRPNKEKGKGYGGHGWYDRRKGFNKGKQKRYPHWAYRGWQDRQRQAGKAGNKGKQDDYGGVYTADGYRDANGQHWEFLGHSIQCSFNVLLSCNVGTHGMHDVIMS